MEFLKKLWHCFFVWRFAPANEAELTTADAIVTQACSRMKDGSPGPGNNILAVVTRQMYERYPVAGILPQDEIALADPGLPYSFVARGRPDGRSTVSWNTYEVAKMQAAECFRRGWKKVIVVAFPMHMGRALWTYEKIGLDPLPAPMPSGMKQYLHRNLVHWSHHGRLRIIIRELFCRLLFLVWGWI